MGEGNGTPLQYCCLENSMGRGAWQATVHGVTKSWTWLSDFHFQWIWPLINQTLFSWAPKSLQMVTVAMKLNDADELGQHIKKKRHHFAHKAPYSQSYGFSSSHVWMWELGHKEGWVPRNWCLWTVVLEKTLDSESVPWTARRSNQSILKEINP